MEQWQKEALELRAAKPKHVLFLCVANSARSQLAEGIARSLAPKNIKISELSEQELFDVQNKINNRPRKMFGYQSAAELFYRNMQPQQHFIGE